MAWSVFLLILTFFARSGIFVTYELWRERILSQNPIVVNINRLKIQFSVFCFLLSQFLLFPLRFQRFSFSAFSLVWCGM
jgi:hypothetical protein